MAILISPNMALRRSTLIEDKKEEYRMSGTSSSHGGRGHWRPEEDRKLRELVALHGPHNWNFIASKLQARSGKSCRLRWVNQLDPRIDQSKFSEEEDEKLMAAHRLYGNKWALIAGFFPGRTDNGVKNHWHVLMARNGRNKKMKETKTAEEEVDGGARGRRLMVEDDDDDDAAAASNSGPGNVNTSEDSGVTEKRESLSCFEGAINGGLPESPPPFIDFLGVGRNC